MKKYHRDLMIAQESFLEPIIVDNFAGGGGASTGIELATGRIVNIAINHDPAAILMHKTNHPHTEHLQASVWDVDPIEVCRGRPVALAWFSPDCKHFSKAKGAALVDKKIRGLAWIVLRWAALVRPTLILLENVEEFQTWGPVRKGKPVKRKAGQTFAKWKDQLSKLGYAIEHRVLCAADYGAPTIRKRFVLVARCDGKPIRFPKPTHAPRDSDEVKSGKLKPWRSAAEIIDWSLPTPSIFATKAEIAEQYGVKAVRPLAKNTMRRIIRGVDKFTLKSGKPFIVPTGYGERKGQAPRVNDIDAPLNTVVSSGKHNVCSAQLIQYHTEQSESARASGINAPINTIDASNRYGLTTASLVEYYGNGMPIAVAEPMRTVTSHDREALTAVHLDKYYAGSYKGCGASAADPMPTATTHDRSSVVAAHIAEYKGKDIGQDARRPLRTITASAGEFGVVTTHIERCGTGDYGHWAEIRALLNEYCDYHLADDEVLVLTINGAQYFIADIGLRMLTPRELYNAMGFPPDYQIDMDYTGKPYPKTEQVARCGNAVCPQMAAAVVRANWQEAAVYDIETMAELSRRVAV